MTREELNILIQNVQCRHSSWLADFEKTLSLGLCTNKMYHDNIMISNLIKVMYRYQPFEEEVTNADSISFSAVSSGTYSVTITYGVIIANVTVTGGIEDIINALIVDINTYTSSHGYYAINIGNILYLYTYEPSENFSDNPTIYIVEDGLTSITEDLEDNLDPILNYWNCLTLDEFCSIENKIINLTSECGCNK